MRAGLYAVLKWAEREGEVQAIARIRLKVLPFTISEGIALNFVTPETLCSEQCYRAVLEASEEVVGRPFDAKQEQRS